MIGWSYERVRANQTALSLDTSPLPGYRSSGSRPHPLAILCSSASLSSLGSRRTKEHAGLGASVIRGFVPTGLSWTQPQTDALEEISWCQFSPVR